MRSNQGKTDCRRRSSDVWMLAWVCCWSSDLAKMQRWQLRHRMGSLRAALRRFWLAMRISRQCQTSEWRSLKRYGLALCHTCIDRLHCRASGSRRFGAMMLLGEPICPLTVPCSSKVYTQRCQLLTRHSSRNVSVSAQGFLVALPQCRAFIACACLDHGQ